MKDDGQFLRLPAANGLERKGLGFLETVGAARQSAFVVKSQELSRPAESVVLRRERPPAPNYGGWSSDLKRI
jgi:hypothetical protein